MTDQVQTQTLHVPSTDGHTTIRAKLWLPEGDARGVVQLVHGMAEHIDRYDRFAAFLAGCGYAVCGHDHVGHGLSVDSPEDWGHLPVKGGRDILVNDVGRVREAALGHLDVQRPYVVFGHSMGSFVVRAYIAECGASLDAAIICGTGHIAPAMSSAGNGLARAISRVRGERYDSKLLGNLSVGAYAKAIEDARTPLDWLSYNRQNVDDYIADPACGFAFTAGGNATLTALTREVCTKECFARVPHDLPLLFVAGDGDPVGDMGKGVRTAAQMARDAGITDVTCTIYEHMRHEILNEDDADRVYRDIVTWMEERI